MRVYPSCLCLFLLFVVVDIFFFSFRNGLISNSGEDYQRSSTTYILLLAHGIVVFLELATVLTSVGNTFWVEGFALREMLSILKFYMPFFVAHIFFVIFNTLYAVLLVHSPLKRRPWSTPTYSILMILHFLFFLSYFLSGTFVFGILSEKTLYPPYSTRVYSAPSLVTSDGDREEGKMAWKTRARRMEEDGSRSRFPTPLRKQGAFASLATTDVSHRMSLSDHSRHKRGKLSDNLHERGSAQLHQSKTEDTETNADLSSLLKSIPTLDMPKPIDHPETVELLAHGLPRKMLVLPSQENEKKKSTQQ